ncbi:hypothetical protein [Calothrix sp. PCC 6303]|uniref:hypothetical protein n=1 Tax=Calothrix sp. PCC 6303 TaxID=1170562 RepID=UPI0002A03D51|nr:hypothetical protein [Calothrix sp. PCC 6303]AFZ03644.1 hypothetical protein Cal6303_4745 [Calothrix sp. PCC 6303]
MLSLYITLAICGTILTTIFMLRDRLKEFFLSLSSEGKLETKVTANDKQLPQKLENPYTIDISGNKTLGETKVLLERDNTRLKDNDFKGKTDISVKFPTQTSQTPDISSNIPSNQNIPQPSSLPEAMGEVMEAELIPETEKEPG